MLSSGNYRFSPGTSFFGKDGPTSTELALSYAVDRRLGVGHGMYDGVANTVFPLDI